MVLIKGPLNLGTQTFRLSRSDKTGAPRPGYWEAADCRKFECNHYLLGWKTQVDPSTARGQQQAYYIRELTERSFREEIQPSGIIVFSFEAGQKCFRTHEMPVDRDPEFTHRVPGKDAKVMDYDEFQDTWNETVVRIGQNKREV